MTKQMKKNAAKDAVKQFQEEELIFTKKVVKKIQTGD